MNARSLETQQDNRPPPTLKVVYCDKCGRNDIVQSIGERHFNRGKWCVGGKLRVAVYRREEVEQ